jgi:hypothetical protein
MNLHAIAGPIVAAINPPISGQYKKSSGYTTDDDGSQVPVYADPIDITVQKQPLSSRDLMQLDGLNLNGEKCAMYVTGNIGAVSRPDARGGDLITLSDGSVWLVAQELENWYLSSGWVKVAATRQNGS